MKIISYSYHDIVEDGWCFDEVRLGNVNLFVGASGSGKSRLLNTLFNIGTAVVTDDRCYAGYWKMRFICNGEEYQWEYKAIGDDPNDPHIIFEKITKTEEKSH